MQNFRYYVFFRFLDRPYGASQKHSQSPIRSQIPSPLLLRAAAEAQV